MSVRHDSCILNNTESFLYTISCNVDIVEDIIVIWKVIPFVSMLFVFFYHYFYALNFHRDHIQVSIGVL